MIRYRFREFTLSPQRRLLVREGREVPLIPRYFDLLVLLIEQRHQAVHRRDIFERVWADAHVSDSALSQAIRTIRRTLGDDSTEPRFIRTVSRHGYRFVFAEVVEEDDEGTAPIAFVEAAGVSAGDTRDASRWIGAAAGGGVAGLVAGGLGGALLAAAPGSAAPIVIAPVLAVMGGSLGALAGAGVGAGIAAAESRSRSALSIVAGGAVGGGLVGLSVEWLARWGLAVLLGLDVAIGGGLEGIVIGAAAAVGYAVATGTRWRSALIIAALSGLAGLALALAGYPLVGGTIHVLADAVSGSRATLAPLGRLIGDPGFGLVPRAILACGEAATFGLGLAYGLLKSRG